MKLFPTRWTVTASCYDRVLLNHCRSHGRNIPKHKNEESFDAFYDIVPIKVKEFSVIAEPPVSKKRRAPTRCELGDAQPTYPDTARDHYKKVYSEAVDNLNSSIKERFNQPAFIIYASLEMLLLKAAKGENTFKEIEDLTLKFRSNVNVKCAIIYISSGDKRRRFEAFSIHLKCVH